MIFTVGESIIEVSSHAELRSIHVEYKRDGTVDALQLWRWDGPMWAILATGDEVPEGGMPPGVYKLSKKRESE